MVNWDGQLVAYHTESANAMEILPASILTLSSPEQRQALLETVKSFPEATCSMGHGIGVAALPPIEVSLYDLCSISFVRSFA